MDSNNDYDFLNKYKRLPRSSTSPYNNNSTVRYNHSPQPNFNTSYMNAQNMGNRTVFGFDDQKHPQLRKQLALGKSYVPQQQQQQQQQQQSQQQQQQQQQSQQRRASVHKERLLNNMNNTYTHLAMSNSDVYFNQLPSSIQPPERKKSSTPRTKFCTICCNTYCSCYNVNWLKNTTTSSMTMSSYVDPGINNAPAWMYNQHNQPPLPPLPSPKPQPPPPPEDDLNDVHKENHERKSSLFVRTPEKINKNSCTGNRDSIKPLSPPPPPPDTPLLDELLDYSINTTLDSPPRHLGKLQFTKSNCPSTNSNSGATAKRHNLCDTGLEQMKPNKKTISGRYGTNVPKEWSPDLATQALSVEAEYIQSVERLPVLLIRFPDPEINRDIVTRYSDNIIKVIFLHSPARRYCTVHLKRDADVAKTIDSISKIPFGNGFLQAEVKRRTIVDPVQSNPEDIDPFTLYVGNLYNSITRNELRRYFPGSSRIDMGFAVHLKKTRYAFIRYSNVDDAVKAFKQTYNTQIGDRTVIIRFRRINPACVRTDVEAQEACLMEQDALMADAVISETTVNNGTTLNRSKDNGNERPTNSANVQVREVASKNQSKDPQMTQNQDTLQKSHNMENDQNKENGPRNPPHVDMPLKPSVINCAVQTDPIVDLIDRQQTQLSNKSKVIRPEKARRYSTSADKNINQSSSNQTEVRQPVENGNGREIHSTTPASIQHDRNVSDITIKSESDVNDDDIVSSRILGKRFQSLNNNEIKTEPEENDFGLLNVNDMESNMTTNSNEILMNSFSSTTTTTSTTSHSINILDDSIVNEHLHNANDAIPSDNLLGKRSIKSESNDCNDSESCSTFTSQEMQISKPPASKKRKKRISKIKEITAAKRLATTSNHATTTLDKPSNTDIICIDDDESDDSCDDDLTIITQTNTNNLEALRQRELQTRDIKQDLLRRLDDNFPLNASSATSVSERSAFVKKLYNEIRDIEGANKQPQNEWDSVEKLLWSH